MTVSRELLWIAYPDGFLAMSGMSTVGGWTSLGVMGWVAPPGAEVGNRDEPRHSYRVVWHESLTVDRNLHTGDLLPNLDPVGDPATWACALRDLATAVGFDCTKQPSLGWIRELNGVWWLSARTFDIRDSDAGKSHLHAFPGIDTDDPATALALARASLRGRKCSVCGKITDLCCSDCAIDGHGAVYVCSSSACRDTHETTCSLRGRKE